MTKEYIEGLKDQIARMQDAPGGHISIERWHLLRGYLEGMIHLCELGESTRKCEKEELPVNYQRPTHTHNGIICYRDKCILA